MYMCGMLFKMCFKQFYVASCADMRNNNAFLLMKQKVALVDRAFT